MAPIYFTNYNHLPYVYIPPPIPPVFLQGDLIFTSNGTFTVPTGVTNVSIIAVGGGGAGGGIATSAQRSSPGGGGALAYVNDISVTPGETLDVFVGQRGLANNNAGKPGGNSFVQRSGTDLVHAGGGMAGFWVPINTDPIGLANGGIVVVGTGGNGGNGVPQQGSGAGAGGYAGRGGNSRSGSGTGNSPATGSGGGASGGRNSLNDGADGGSGVGIFGIGADGVPGNGTTPSTGGSGGGSSQGVGTNDFGGYGGDYGGGGGAPEDATAPQLGGNGGNGVVRIIWSTYQPRLFPSSNVGNLVPTLTYVGFGEDLNNQSTYTFTNQSVGNASNGRFVVIVASVSGASSGTISNLQYDGVSANLIMESSATVAAGGDSHHRVYYVQENTKTTANIVVTNTVSKGRCYISVYNLVNPANAIPLIVSNTPLYTTSVTGLFNRINVVAGDLILAFATSDNRTFTWTGATENNESTSEAGSPVVSHANTTITSNNASYNVGVTYSTAGTNAKLFTLRWC